jgi:hypothetical protein
MAGQRVAALTSPRRAGPPFPWRRHGGLHPDRPGIFFRKIADAPAHLDHVSVVVLIFCVGLRAGPSGLAGPGAPTRSTCGCGSPAATAGRLANVFSPPDRFAFLPAPAARRHPAAASLDGWLGLRRLGGMRPRRPTAGLASPTTLARLDAMRRADPICRQEFHGLGGAATRCLAANLVDKTSFPRPRHQHPDFPLDCLLPR